MQDLRITLIQSDQQWENKEVNLIHFSDVIDTLETDLILLPEMFQTGFTMNSADMAEPIGHSSSIQWLVQKAAERNTAIYTSLIVLDGEHYYNQGIFVKPSGECTTYNKRKLFSLAGEDNYFSPGEKAVIVEYLGWKINLQICYDLRFPELVRNKLQSDDTPQYDLLLYVANWPEKRITHWDALLPARAIENQCYVAAVNRIGMDNNQLHYNGHSQIIDPLGQVVFKAEGSMIETIVIKSKHLAEIREKLPFLKDQ